MYRKGCVKAQEKVAICKSKREASDEINPLDILIFDFRLQNCKKEILTGSVTQSVVLSCGS